MAAIPCIEIFKFFASDAYKADPSIFDPVAEAVLNTAGCHGFYTGKDSEDPNLIWMIVVWETVEHHYTLMNDKDAYPALTALFEKASSKVDSLHHVKAFSADVRGALDAPMTEFAVWDKHADTDKAEFQASVASLIENFGKLAPKALHRGGWGEPVENESRIFVCQGWDSVEEHMNFVPNTPALMDPIIQMQTRAGLKLYHTKLTKHEKK